MAEQCCAPDCENNAMSGPLCFTCEKRWMAERRDVVDEAEHVAVRAAEFSAWCRAHGEPDPFKD